MNVQKKIRIFANLFQVFAFAGPSVSQVAALIVVVLVGIPYLVLWYSLTADEEEDKFDQAHR